MPLANPKQQSERESNIQLAMRAFWKSEKPSMREMATKYGIPYSTLRDRLNGAQDRKKSHEHMQLFTEQEEKAVVRWCKSLDDWGFPPKLTLVKQMAGHLMKNRASGQKLGKHWLKQFLNPNPELASRFSSRLDRQRALASNPAVLRDYFTKV